MDRKSVIILSVCALLFLLWAQMVPRLYPPAKVQKNDPLASNAAPATAQATSAVPQPSTPGTFVPPKPGAPEELLVLTNDTARYTFTSHGGGLKMVELLKYPDSVACRDKSSTATNRLATLNSQAQQPVLSLIGSEELVGDGVFKISRFSSSQADGTDKARLVDGIRLEKLLTNNLYLVKEFEPGSTYLLKARVRFENRSGQPIDLPPQQWVVGTATPLNPQDDEESVGFHWWNGNKFKGATQSQFSKGGFACIPGTPLTEHRPDETNIVWATVHNQFFVLALMPQVPATELYAVKYDLPPPTKEERAADPSVKAKQFAFRVNITQSATNLPPNQALERQFTIYAGPKEYRTLERIGVDLKNELEHVMEFGFFGIVSKLLLLSMNGLNALGLNYGLAIIAITVIIKLLFWPLTQASTRSMKRMQALQPQMKAIQEKFKDDPAKMNKKVMEFMKENKVSPLGGCLPLVLQVPVFIGFFQMVRSAIELRGASFLWACDLSRPDTIFTIPGLDFNVNPLPLLMGGTMLWQASLTPPSPGMDPSQQKIMKYFPLIFLFMLYNYSAGLTLYWTVQNLLSIAQMKLTKAYTPVTVAAVAKPGKPISPKRK